MKLFLFIVSILVPVICAAQTSDPDIRVRQLGPDSYELIITTSQTTEITIAQDALVPSAKKICGDKEAEFGHYKFEAKEPINASSSGPRATLTLSQEIKCGVTAQEQTQASAASQNPWQPTHKDQAMIERLTQQYLHEKDLGHYKNAYSMFTGSMKEAVNPESWQSNAQQFNTKAGKVLSREVSKITWYNYPPTSPTPGIYAAADYVSRFENIDIHCGYVAWLKQNDGGFRIVREEENYIDKATQAGMKESDIEKTKVLFRCKREAKNNN